MCVHVRACVCVHVCVHVCVCMCVCVHVCVPAYLWLLSQTDDKVAWERSLHPRRNIEPNVPA